MNTVHAEGPDARSARRVHREIFQLSALIVIALGGFVLTRTLAASNRQTSLEDAGAWYLRGERALEAGDGEAAIDAFRRAAIKNRSDRTYALALAGALERSGDPAAAERALLALRDSTPEDAEINLRLARLAAARSDVDQALRYYRNALYAPSSAADARMRQATRLELIRFLLDHRDFSRALSELLVASTDSPGDVPTSLQLGELFARAGDYGRAQGQFERVLPIDRRNVEALVGAGTAAFEQGHYAEALRYLRGAPTNRSDIQGLRDVAELVSAHDPLGNRLASAERRHRLVADLKAVHERLEACDLRRQRTPEATAVAQQIDAFASRLSPRVPPDQDILEAGVDLVYRGEQVTTSCDAPAALDRALFLVGRLHAEDR